MTPKEKAIELFDKFNDEIPSNDSANVDEFMQRDVIASKNCALIAVDEMIIQNGEIYLMQFGEKATDYYRLKNNYLFEVKQELEKL